MSRARAASRASAFVVLGAIGCGDIEPPVLLDEQESVRYPFPAWDAGTVGEVMLRVRVTPDGTVDSVELQTTSGKPALDSAALVDAWKLLFEPARRADEEIAAWVSVPVRFEREDSVVSEENGP